MPFWKRKPKRRPIARPKTNAVLPKEVCNQRPKPKPASSPSKSKSDIPKKSAASKAEFKHQDARKEFLKVFKQLTY